GVGGGASRELLPAALVADQPWRAGRVAHAASDRATRGDVRHTRNPYAATPLDRVSIGPARYEHRSVGRARRLARGNRRGALLVGTSVAPSSIGIAQCDAAAARRSPPASELRTVSRRTRLRRSPPTRA